MLIDATLKEDFRPIAAQGEFMERAKVIWRSWPAALPEVPWFGYSSANGRAHGRGAGAVRGSIRDRRAAGEAPPQDVRIPGRNVGAGREQQTKAIAVDGLSNAKPIIHSRRSMGFAAPGHPADFPAPPSTPPVAMHRTRRRHPPLSRHRSPEFHRGPRRPNHSREWRPRRRTVRAPGSDEYGARASTKTATSTRSSRPWSIPGASSSCSTPATARCAASTSDSAAGCPTAIWSRVWRRPATKRRISTWSHLARPRPVGGLTEGGKPVF